MGCGHHKKLSLQLEETNEISTAIEKEIDISQNAFNINSKVSDISVVNNMSRSCGKSNINDCNISQDVSHPNSSSNNLVNCMQANFQMNSCKKYQFIQLVCRYNSSNLYERLLFGNINKVRSNPKDFIPYLKYFIQTAFQDKSKNYIIVDNKKVYLREGLNSIRKAIARLNSSPSLLPLTNNESLRIHIPYQGSWSDPGYLIQAISQQRLIKKKNVYLNIDISSFSPLNCLLLQIIDDNGLEGQRYANIMNQHINYCSITATHSSLIKEPIFSSQDAYAIYCVFS